MASDPSAYTAKAVRPDAPMVQKRRHAGKAARAKSANVRLHRFRPPSSSPGQEIKDAGPVEKLTNARARIRDTELAVRNRSQVE